MSFWTHLRSEIREGAQLTWHWSLRAWMTVIAIHVAVGFLAGLLQNGSLASRLGTLASVSTYGVLQGLVAGLVVGLLALVRRLAGWGLAAPCLLIPAAVLVACWLGRNPLSAAAHDFVTELSHDTPATEMIAALAPVPPLFLMLLPVVIISCVLSFKLFCAAIILYYISMLVMASGVIAGGALSIPVLLIATYRRVRHRARQRNHASLVADAVY